jgi:hypothetical protein
MWINIDTTISNFIVNNYFLSEILKVSIVNKLKRIPLSEGEIIEISHRIPTIVFPSKKSQFCKLINRLARKFQISNKLKVSPT